MSTKQQDLFEKLEFRGFLKRGLHLQSDNQQKEILRTPKEVNKGEIQQMDLFTNSLIKGNSNKRRNVQYEIITTIQKAENVISELMLKNEVAIQLCLKSTYGLNEELLGVSLCNTKEKAFFISIPQKQLFTILKPLFENSEILVIGNELKSQIKILAQNNISINSHQFDISIAHYLLHG